jgi:hypothetical protein
MRIIRTFVTGTVLMGAFATPVLAQDFRFTVPVTVSHAPPNVRSLTMTCEAGQMVDRQGFHANAQATSAALPVTGGAFSGDVSVSVSAGAWDWRLLDRPQYRCYVVFAATDAVSGAAFEYFRPSTQLLPGGLLAPPPHPFPVAATPASVTLVTGVIPRS